MSKSYAILAQQIVAAIGGVDNVAVVIHYMTRLYFMVEDDEEVDGPTLKGPTGVLGIVRNGNQCQVAIDNTVSQVHREVVNLLPDDLCLAEPQSKAPLTLRRIGAGVLDTLIGIMPPPIPVVIGGPMVRLLAMIPRMGGMSPKDSPTLTLLTLIGDGMLFFLPLMVAASAAVKSKTNMSLAIAIAGALMHPGFIKLIAGIARDEHAEFTFTPVTVVKYACTVISALVMAQCPSYIERQVDRTTPAMMKNFFKLTLIVLITILLAILLTGPLGIWIDSIVSALAHTTHSYFGWLSVAIMGGLWPLLVMTGTYRVSTSTIIRTIAETGKEGVAMPLEIGANLSLGGPLLAMVWKAKNPELCQTALVAAAPAILVGISESALYGVVVRPKRPLIASLISGFICGVMVRTVGLASHPIAASGLFASVRFLDPANPVTTVWVFGVMALSVVLPFVLTLILGFEDIPVEQAAASAIVCQTRAQASHA